MRNLPFILFAASLGTAAVAAPVVYPESPMVKVMPTQPAASGTPANLVAARNEIVSFQVVVHGADSGATGVSASFTGLSGPAQISGKDLTLYREAYLDIQTPTFPTASAGRWPDALIPDVDEIVGEKRNAFPFDVPAGESRVIWVDVHVPTSAAPGQYQGTVNVTGGVSAQVPVTLTVLDATMPSTPTLSTAFLIYPGDVCQAHTGTSDCGGTAQTDALVGRYEQIALEHRITLSNIFNTPNQGSDWTAFDAAYGPFLDGTAPLRLTGAKMTSAQYPGARDPSAYGAFEAHFQAKGWLSRAYDYTADEPPYGASWDDVVNRAAIVRQGAPDLRTLVTTTMQDAQAHSLLPSIDVMVPVVNWIDGTAAPYQGDQRGQYDSFLGGGGSKALWLYQSCMSQGCAYGTTAPENTATAGWPSYMVDASAARNRAMQWVDFRERAGGELYYDTALSLGSAWSDQYKYNGNGEGNLFYPGTPANIGGSTDIPIGSIRLKMIRAGIQDFEWLQMVSAAGDPGFAKQTAESVFPSSSQVGDDGSVLENARLALTQRLMQLTGKPAPAPVPVTTNGGTPPPASTPGSPSSTPASQLTNPQPDASGAPHKGGCAADPTALVPILGALGALALLRKRGRRPVS